MKREMLSSHYTTSWDELRGVSDGGCRLPKLHRTRKEEIFSPVSAGSAAAPKSAATGTREGTVKTKRTCQETETQGE